MAQQETPREQGGDTAVVPPREQGGAGNAIRYKHVYCQSLSQSQSRPSQSRPGCLLRAAPSASSGACGSASGAWVVRQCERSGAPPISRHDDHRPCNQVHAAGPRGCVPSELGPFKPARPCSPCPARRTRSGGANIAATFSSIQRPAPGQPGLSRAGQRPGGFAHTYIH